MPSQSDRITKRLVDTLTPHATQDLFVWDDKLSGFGVRMKPSGSGSYIIQYRTKHAQTRRHALGKIGTLTPDEARKRARDLLIDAPESDPSARRKEARQAITVSDLCDTYMKEVRSMPGRRGKIKKESTLAIDNGRIEKHIKPLLGTRAVVSLKRLDIEKLQMDVATGKTAIARPKNGRTGVVTGGKGAAARVIGLFGAILEFAIRKGIIEDNPARGIPKFSDGKKDRFLSAAELKALGSALNELGKDKKGRVPVAALTTLLLTGCRRMEVLGLRWDEVNPQGHCFQLRDTKTGPQCRPIGATALEFVSQICPAQDDRTEWVFPAFKGDGHLIGL